MNNFDMNQIMSILSKMNKADLEKGIAAANEILKSKDKENIIKEMKKHNM